MDEFLIFIILGMSLTQVSTWFANARRRLKKENKWSPDGSCDDSENVSDSGASEETSGVEQRVPHIPLADESGYSSSDRDSGSPPTQIPLIPPQMAYPIHPTVMGYPTLTSVQPKVTPSELQMPRYMPKAEQAKQPIDQSQAPKRQARSLWSIADIATDNNSEEEESVDVTA